MKHKAAISEFKIIPNVKKLKSAEAIWFLLPTESNNANTKCPNQLIYYNVSNLDNSNEEGVSVGDTLQSFTSNGPSKTCNLFI